MDFEDEEPLERTFNELCDELCIDNVIRDEAWEKYRSVWSNYSLDGEPMQWLVCSLYQCVKQKAYTDSVGDAIDVPTVISLSRLLKLSGVTLIQFFFRMKFWVEMVNIVPQLKARLSMIESQFAVTQICFRKFCKIFPQVFKHFDMEGNKMESKMQARTKSARQKGKSGTSNEIFSFTWTLFLQVKAFFPRIADDLINCYHLLLVCLDWLYMNCLSCNRQDLVNASFQPTDSTNLSILEDLCDRYDGVAVSAKAIQGYYFRKCVDILFDKKVLRAEDEFEYFYLVLSPSNFDHSYTHLNNTYEMFILSDGDLDERILLSENAECEIGISAKTDCKLLLDDEAKQLNPKLKYILDTTKFIPLCEDDQILKKGQISDFLCPAIQSIAHSQNLVTRLQVFLHEKDQAFTAETLSIFKTCGESRSVERVRNYVNSTSHRFITSYAAMNLNIEIGEKYAQLGITLYYVMIDKVLSDELYRLDRDSDNTSRLKDILTSETFHCTLAACCLQIVLYSVGLGEQGDLAFPWILEGCEISPLQMFNLLSATTASSLGSFDFPRDITRHLNRCAEHIMLRDAWNPSSSLWRALQQNRGSGPSFSEVTDVSQSSKLKPGILQFYKCLYELIADRVLILCQRLELPSILAERAEAVVRHCVEALPYLLRQRNLDQIILCAIYTVCRSSDTVVSLTFIQVIGAYRKCFESVRPEDYREVPLDDNGDTNGDLVAFYNTVFLKEIEDFVLQLLGGKFLTREEAITAQTATTRTSLLVERGIPSMRRLAYSFQGAPGRDDLQAINATLSQHAIKVLGKRGSRQLGLGVDPTAANAAKRMNLVGLHHQQL